MQHSTKLTILVILLIVGMLVAVAGPVAGMAEFTVKIDMPFDINSIDISSVGELRHGYKGE